MDFDDGCGRYVLQVKAKDLAKRYNLAKEPAEIGPSYDIKPTHTLPVVVEPHDGQRTVKMMKWGLIPLWAKDPKLAYFTFNARDDALFDKPIWRSVIYKQRTLVPATGYFEWTKPAKESKAPKRKYFFRPKQMDIFSFAGVWSAFKDAEGKQLLTYSIITTEPNKEARKVHNRMPAILYPEEESAWLSSSTKEPKDIKSLLHPFADGGLIVKEVSSDTGGWGYDDERRIAALNSR